MPSYCIELSTETVLALGARDRHLLRKLINDVKADQVTLSKLLTHYCKDDRGSVDDDSIEIEEESSLVEKNSAGHLLITFQEDAYYGCPDMAVHADRECEVAFHIDSAPWRIVLSVPESSLASYYHENE